MANHIITTTWKENMLLESDNPHGKHVLMETDTDFGGSNQGLNPKALMLSSLGGCTALDVLSLLKKMRIEVEDFNVVVNGELTEEHPKYYHNISVDYYFKGIDLNEDKIKKVVSLSEERYCGVIDMFRKFSKLTFRIHIN